MDPVHSFLIGIGLTLVGSLAVVIYLRRHLRRILVDLCGTEPRADFWAAFSNITLVLVPLICALFKRPEGGTGSAVFFDVSAQLTWALIGLVVAVLILGFVIGRFVPPPPPASGPR